MKKFIILLFFSLSVIFLNAQENDRDILNKINNNQAVTATTTSATRLFADKDDLSSVLFIVPKGSSVQLTGIDSSYYKISYDGTGGYIVRRHATVNKDLPKNEIGRASCRERV